MKQDLTHLNSGASGKVVSLQGGLMAIKKLKALGIVPGSNIVKKSAALMHGPIIIQRGAVSVAIGFNLAKLVIVEPDTKK